MKTVHNGIEYGLMQPSGEGFEILNSKSHNELPEGTRYTLHIGDIAEAWGRGSVVSSCPLDLAAGMLADDEWLERFTGFVEDSREGGWNVDAAVEEAVAPNVLAATLFTRFRSCQEQTFGENSLSAKRFVFGGHLEHTLHRK